MKPDFGIFSTGEPKVVQFFADKAVLFLSYIILGFVIIDSFINLLPNGHGTVECFINNNSVTSGQQSYIDEYCSDFVPGWTYSITILIFGQGLLTVLLHYSWYALVLYVSSVQRKANDDKKTAEYDYRKLVEVDKNIAEADKSIAKVNRNVAEEDKKIAEADERMVMMAEKEEQVKEEADNNISVQNKHIQDSDKCIQDQKETDENKRVAGCEKKIAERKIKFQRSKTMIAQANIKIAEADKEIAEAGRKKAMENKKIAEKYKKTLEVAKKKLVDKYTSTDRGAAEARKLKAAVEQYKNAVKVAAETYRNAVKAAIEKHKGAEAEVERNNALKKAKTEYEDTLKRVTKEYETAVKAVAEVEPAKEAVEEYKEAAEEYKKAVNNKKYEEAVEAVTQEYEKLIKATADEYETAIQAVDMKYNTEIQAVDAEYTEAVKMTWTAEYKMAVAIAKANSKKANETAKRSFLILFYFLKNAVQFSLSVIAMVLAFLYEFSNELPEIRKSFSCYIYNIDYWAGLNIVQCFYHPIALNDVFIVFYGIMSILVMCATIFGVSDIFIRPDLTKTAIKIFCCCCKRPIANDASILKYCLDQESKSNATAITIYDAESYIRSGNVKSIDNPSTEPHENGNLSLVV